jgi:hypothetical protein
MAHSQVALARDRIQGMQAAAAQQHEARHARIRRRALRQAERAERKARRFAQAARRLRAGIAEAEGGR